jgi:hypothetical protein
MSLFDYIKSRIRSAILEFLNLENAAEEIQILSNAVIEHDKMLAINAIVQVKILSDLNNIAHAKQANMTRIRKDDDDLDN